MCSVSTTRSRTPASIASSAAARAVAGGMNMTATSNGVSRIASPAVANTGTPQCTAPARFGLTPATTLVP